MKILKMVYELNKNRMIPTFYYPFNHFSLSSRRKTTAFATVFSIFIYHTCCKVSLILLKILVQLFSKKTYYSIVHINMYLMSQLFIFYPHEKKHQEELTIDC